MKHILFFSTLLLGLVIASCNSNESEEPVNIQSKERVVKDEIIYRGESSYAKFFNSNVSGEITYQSSREHPMHARDFSAGSRRTGGYSQLGANNGIAVLVNGKAIEVLTKANADKLVQNADGRAVPAGLYGENVTFSFPRGSMVRSQAASSGNEITMYVPEVVEILYPKHHQSLHPICYFDRYKLKWNADVNNKNGVVVVVEWDGDILAKESVNQSIRKVDIVEDNGEAVLKKEMFNDMPHLAIAKVTIVRGAIDIAEVDDVTYKIYAESDATLYTIIAREPLK